MMIDSINLTQKIQDLLNANSLGLTFRTYFWIKNLDRTFEVVDANTLQSFIPSIFTNSGGQYRPIAGLNMADYDATLTIYFPQSQKVAVDMVLKEFAQSIVGQMVNIGTEAEPHFVPMNMDTPVLTEVRDQHISVINEYDKRLALSRTKTYGVIQIRLYYLSSDNGVYGNQVKYFLSKTAILPLNQQYEKTFNITETAIFNYPADATFLNGIITAGDQSQITMTEIETGKSIASVYDGSTYTIPNNALTPGMSYLLDSYVGDPPYAKPNSISINYTIPTVQPSGQKEELVRYQSTITNSAQTSVEQLVKNSTSTTINQVNSVLTSIDCYFLKNSIVLKQIIEDAMNGVNQNKIYQLTIVYSDLFTIISNVLVINIQVIPSLGDGITASINFQKADTESLEENQNG